MYIVWVDEIQHMNGECNCNYIRPTQRKYCGPNLTASAALLFASMTEYY